MGLFDFLSNIFSSDESRPVPQKETRKPNHGTSYASSSSERDNDDMEAWAKIKEAYKNKATILCSVTEVNDGGLIVVKNDIQGFVPKSRIDKIPCNDFSSFVGKDIKVKVIELTENKHEFIASRRDVLWEDEKRRKEKKKEEEKAEREALEARIKVNNVLEGTVCKILDGNKGVLVKLSKWHTGMLPISEISWDKDDDIQDIIKEGQSIRVLVLKHSENYGRILLSRKQLQPKPKEQRNNTANNQTKQKNNIQCPDEDKEKRTFKLRIKEMNVKTPCHIITESFGKYEFGIVFSTSIQYQGTPMRPELVCGLCEQQLKPGVECPFTFEGEICNGRAAKLTIDISNFETNDETLQKVLDEQTLYEKYLVKVKAICNDYIVVSYNDGIEGYINIDEFKDDEIPDEGDEIEARLLEKGSNVWQYCHYSALSLENGAYDREDAIIDNDTRYRQFFNDSDWKSCARMVMRRTLI